VHAISNASRQAAVPYGHAPMSEDPVLLEVSAAVARVTLNRPAAANAIDLTVARALAQAADDIAARGDVRAVLLAGAGDRFCGGGDVRSFAGAGDQLDARLAEIVDALHRGVVAFAALDLPIVAAVQGSAAGAGLSLVAAADIVIAAESAKFVMAYTAIGLTPDGGSTWFLERSIGRQRALELVLTNRALSAREAMDWGLVARVVADEDLGTEADRLATALAAGPTSAFGAAKRLLRAAPTATLPEQLAAEATAIVRAGASRDAREGVAAFAEKRRPEFDGRPA
jgi:2-(1,2-epoxy-1,2-dihydrophenyl)acetyl-CoA isomerase